VNWFKHLAPEAQAAVIAAAVAALTAMVTAISTATNLVLKARLDRRAVIAEERGVRRDLYRKYADPLTSAAESLYWRLHEVFEDGRSGYLAPGGGRTRFEHYKASSTRYRLASLLGWMTALQRELTLCNAEPDKSVAAMRNALSDLEYAMAEGGHIERYRAAKLAELWGLELTKVDVAGRAIDPIIDRCRHENRADSVARLDQDQQMGLLREVASVLCRHSSPTVVSPELIEATRDEAIAALTTREAWIYRDWQSAIGDWMLIQNSDGARRFDVRGYRSFVAREIQPEGDDTEWLSRLHEVTDDLDVQSDPLHDARIEQLRHVYSAVATLILRFSRRRARALGSRRRDPKGRGGDLQWRADLRDRATIAPVRFRMTIALVRLTTRPGDRFCDASVVQIADPDDRLVSRAIVAAGRAFTSAGRRPIVRLSGVDR
jgi:hypothetical protein